MPKNTDTNSSCSSSSNVVRSPPSQCAHKTSQHHHINTDPILDSGTTGNYFPVATDFPLHHHSTTSNPVHVTVTNGQTMTSTHQAHLPFGDALPSEATRVDMFPAPMAAALISVGRLADAGCITTFTKDTVTVRLHDKVIIDGYRNWRNGLYHIKLPNLPNLPPPSAPPMVAADQTVPPSIMRKENTPLVVNSAPQPTGGALANFSTAEAPIKPSPLTVKRLPNQLCYKPTPWNPVAKLYRCMCDRCAHI
jgi:hypothetical protein